MGLFRGKRLKGSKLSRIKPKSLAKKRKARFVVSPIKSTHRKRFIACLNSSFKSPSPKYPKCDWSTKIVMVFTPKSNAKGRKALHFNGHTDVTARSNNQNDIDRNSIQESFTLIHEYEEENEKLSEMIDLISSTGTLSCEAR